MSSEATVVFFGIRYEPTEDELDLLSSRRHPAIGAARKAGLQHYWANFGLGDEKYFLFVGTQIGVVGVQDGAEIAVASDVLKTTIDDTTAKLQNAGFEGVPKLWLQLLST